MILRAEGFYFGTVQELPLLASAGKTNQLQASSLKDSKKKGEGIINYREISSDFRNQ